MYAGVLIAASGAGLEQVPPVAAVADRNFSLPASTRSASGRRRPRVLSVSVAAAARSRRTRSGGGRPSAASSRLRSEVNNLKIIWMKSRL